MQAPPIDRSVQGPPHAGLSHDGDGRRRCRPPLGGRRQWIGSGCGHSGQTNQDPRGGRRDRATRRAKETGLEPIRLDMPESPVYERLTQAVLEAVADDILVPGSSWRPCIAASTPRRRLAEHHRPRRAPRPGSGRDLRQLETRVPLDTLKMVVDLAVEIGREGREGKPLGRCWWWAITARSWPQPARPASIPSGLQPQGTEPRRSAGPRGIKEIAQMDGAIIVSADGVVGPCRYLDSSAANVTLSKGLGARHWAAAAISRATNAVAVTVSQSNGTVRIFHNGETCCGSSPPCGGPWSGATSTTTPPIPRPSLPSPRPRRGHALA